MRILVITDYYIPSRRAGGPVRTIAGIVARLGREIDFYILTSDRDLKSRVPYAGIEPGVWHVVGGARVNYLPPAEKRLCRWRRWLSCLEYDVVYLNSCFSRMTIRTLLLHRLRMVPTRPIVLAPRGEFSTGALALKKSKKVLYLALTKWLGLYNNIIWQASSRYEQQDIDSVIGNRRSHIVVAPNLALEQEPSSSDRMIKEVGSLRVVFLSRIARKKNLDYALRILAPMRGSIDLDIYGPLEDRVYWQECQSLISQMPENVQITYREEVEPERVGDIFSRYHLFLFPTRGENFGHVVLEALLAGCPVLVSDQTPWQGLSEKRAGWVVPLSQPERFRAILSTAMEMDGDTFQEWSRSARAYGEQVANDRSIVEANRRLFLTAYQHISKDDS